MLFWPCEIAVLSITLCIHLKRSNCDPIWGRREHSPWLYLLHDALHPPQTIKVWVDQFGGGVNTHLPTLPLQQCWPILYRGRTPPDHFFGMNVAIVDKSSLRPKNPPCFVPVGSTGSAVCRTVSASGLPQQQPQAGLEGSVIQALGRWSSAAFLLYICTLGVRIYYAPKSGYYAILCCSLFVPIMLLKRAIIIMLPVMVLCRV